MARVKQASGLYQVRYQLYLISFPYMTDEYWFFGPKAGAEAEAKRIKVKTKWPYAYKVKLIKG